MMECTVSIQLCLLWYGIEQKGIELHVSIMTKLRYTASRLQCYRYTHFNRARCSKLRKLAHAKCNR